MADTEQIMQWIREYFPAEEVPHAVAIVTRESGWNPSAINNTSDPNLPGYHPPKPGDSPEYSVGLFQINTLVHNVSGLDLTDPITNIQVAAALWRQEGWRPWGEQEPVQTSLRPVNEPINPSGTGSQGAEGAGSQGAERATSSAEKDCPDWKIGVVTLPGTGYITCFFKAIGALLHFLVNPETWIAIIIRGILTIFGLIILGASLFALLNSLAE